MSLFKNLFKKKTKKQAAGKIERAKEELEKTIPDEKAPEPKREKREEIVFDKALGILKSPKITEKATAFAQQEKYIFNAHKKTNKIEIKKAIEGLYKVKVKKVNVLRTGAKPKRLAMSQGYKKGQKTGFKKAIITLQKGDKIEL